MSKRVNGVPVICAEPDMLCFECGKIAETRPYGKGGTDVCFDCAIKIPDIVEHNMNIKLFGDSGELK